MAKGYIPGITESSYNRTPYPKSGYEMSGIYRAYVEDDQDPLEIGRVRVRIPAMHGVPTKKSTDKSNTITKKVNGKKVTKVTKTAKVNSNSIDTDGLPWAPVASVGAGQDQGSYITPDVGTVVYVAFEGGNPELPVVLGGNYGVGKPYVDNLGYVKDDYGSTDTSNKKAFKESSGKYYQSASRNEVPDDADKGPESKVVYKSPKGATILMKEADGQEELDIIDHAGQIIKMYSPYSDDANSYNSGKRGKARADEFTAPRMKEVNQDDDAQFSIELMTTNGGSIRLASKPDGTNQIILDADEIITTTKIKVGTIEDRYTKKTTSDQNNGSTSDYPFDDGNDDDNVSPELADNGDTPFGESEVSGDESIFD